MDTFQFVAAMTTSLAWPLAAIALAITLRPSIIKLIDKIKSFKGFGAELTIGEQAIEAVAQIESDPQQSDASKEAEKIPIAQMQDAKNEGEKDQVIPNKSDANDEPLPDPVVVDASGAESQAALDWVDWLSDPVVNESEIAASTIKRAKLRLTSEIHRMAKALGHPAGIGRSASQMSNLMWKSKQISTSTHHAVVRLIRIGNDVNNGVSKAKAIDALGYEAAVEGLLANIRTSIGHAANSNVAAGISGQGNLATQNYENILERLKIDLASEFVRKNN